MYYNGSTCRTVALEAWHEWSVAVTCAVCAVGLRLKRWKTVLGSGRAKAAPRCGSAPMSHRTRGVVA